MPYCGHRAPMALAPLFIRCGPDASSDLIRQRAVCTPSTGRDTKRVRSVIRDRWESHRGGSGAPQPPRTMIGQQIQ